MLKDKEKERIRVKEEAVAKKSDAIEVKDQSTAAIEKVTTQKQFNNFNDIKEKVDKILAESIPKMPPTRSETSKPAAQEKPDEPSAPKEGTTLTEE